MLYFLISFNIYQQTRTVRHKNISTQKITTYIPLYSHQIPIQNLLQKKTTMNHYQEQSYFILLKMKLFLLLKHQNHMSNSLHTLITTMVLNFLFLLYLPLVLNQEDLDPTLKTFWSPFALLKWKLSHNYTSEIFKSEMKFSC